MSDDTKDRCIWIDMTDMSSWRGNLTGVQRTVYEIAQRYSKSNDRVRYFVYNDSSRHFIEINFDSIDRMVNAPPARGNDEAPRARKAAESFARILSRYYNSIPDDKRDKIPGSLKVGAKITIKVGEKTARTLLHYARQSRPSELSKRAKSRLDVKNKRQLFGKNDVVCVLGASWDSKTKIIDIAQLRKEVGFKYVQLIHDVIPSFNPHLFGRGFSADFNSRIFESIANADALLCNSLATQEQLKRLCDIMRLKCPPTSLIRLGDDYAQGDNPVRPKSLIKDGEEFILCVGTYEIRKNHMLLYYVVKEAQRRGVAIPRIVIIGRPGWLTSDLTYILQNDPVAVSRIEYLGGVSDNEKTWLFQNCSFTIFPAMFEGWGLPVGESLYYNKPCLSSSESSMPEIGGDLVDYFSPFDSGECLEQIVKYTQKSTLKAKRDRIKKTYKPQSWDDTFLQVHKALSGL